MEYRTAPKHGEEISLLGFGAMRLKTKGTSVDLDLAREQIKTAIDNGINYIDTAYLYGNGSGSNERALGQILNELGYRDKVYLSTKMNRMAIHSRRDMDTMLEKQLENLQTDHIDFYFIHNVISYDDISVLDDMGLYEFIEENTKSGKIRNIGFSFHGSYNDFINIVDDYDWDVTLLQHNYIDNNMQAGIKGIKLAYENDMAVIIMEPLKGGLLAGTMPKEVEKLIANSNTTRSNVDLALSWIFDTPEITCVLSGMNSIDMIEENIEIVNNHPSNPLNKEELELIGNMKDKILELNKISCTGCNYCMPCPKDINIPDIFKYYNDKNLFPEDKSYGVHHTFILYNANINGIIGKAHDASLCVECGLCTSKCPQQLDIPNLIRQVDKSYHGKTIRRFKPLIKKIKDIIM
ncbi:MAG: aldo/keto reductase [Methanosphaera sp.]|nr:aldo/keto reductase [Methanosphaera sp.]